MYHQYTFDTTIIRQLPLYDSLVSAILEKSAFFQQKIDEKDSYRAYKYMPGSEASDIFKKLPEEIAPKINTYYNRLGKNYIYGFDVFKDSTIKIYVRRNEIQGPHIDVLENLSYYPSGIRFQKREFPVKDTALNTHWQYWIFFHQPRLAL